MPDELKEIPQGGLQQLTGRIGRGMQQIGRAMQEGVEPLSAKYPIRSALSNLLITSPLQSAGAALQDYSGTPRDITPEYPYRARLFDPRQPAMVDPRALDLAQFAGPVAGRARNAARFALPDLKAAAIAAYGPDVSAAHVVKPKGGNWVPGDVEGSMAQLKSALIPNYEHWGGGQNVTDAAKAQANALRNWVDTKLNRYIKNELATPEDPVRALAERGISHMQTAEEGFEIPLASVMRRRIEAGQDPMGTGTSPLARQWDYLADRVVGNQTARDLSSVERESVFGNKLVPPETPVHYMTVSPSHNLYLGHLVDELRNALDPAAQLPRNLQLTPEQLSKVTVPQAVERVAKINAWREAQKAEANAARAMNPATVIHREYPTIPGTEMPNERGLRWVELKNLDMPSGWSAPERYEIRRPTPSSETFAIFDKETGQYITTGLESEEQAVKHLQQTINKQTLEDALKYEGETMGHCVGGPGYCEGVSSGSKRIYSLRDAKGQPHVTIEVQPNAILPKWEEIRPYFGAAAEEAKKLPRGYTGQDITNIATEMAKKAMPPNIVQIKGKGNRKPNEEYLPFVQDFVQSGQWSDVGDIHNADMFKLPDNRFVTRKRFEEVIKKLSGKNDPATEVEWLSNQINRDPSWWNNVKPAFDEPAPGNIIGDEAGYAKGGAVKRNDPTSRDAMQFVVWDKALRRQAGGASEPTQAEIEAAMRPATVSPRLRAFANKVTTQPGMPITDRLVGAGEAATSLASGILGSIPAGYEGMAELLRSRDPARAAQAVETGLQRYTYQPRTAAGTQEAQAGAHLLEKLDAPSQYIGDYVLEQTGSPGAATAAKIVLDPLNFLPGPKQLASTVRGVPQMLQEAAIQAYGPGATASHVVPPQGNINLVPQIAAETLKGPDRQPIGNFLKQVQGMPGVTKEGLEEGLAATKILDPTSVVTKAEFEKYVTPSKYEKVNLIDPDDIAEGMLDHYIDEAHDFLQSSMPFDYLAEPMGIPQRYAQDFNALVQMTSMPEFTNAARLSELEAHGVPRGLITRLERDGITTPTEFDLAIDEYTREIIEDIAHTRFRENEDLHGSSRSFSNVQRLVDEDAANDLPESAYQEIGVTHPSQQTPYRHYPIWQNMVGHFRGTMVPTTMREGLALADEAGTVPPGAFLIEEIQSDAQQSGNMTKHLHQVHGTVAKAAIQHALEQGAHTVYIPTSSTIANARSISNPRTMQMLRRVYDKEVPSQAIEPLRKIPGVTITEKGPIVGHEEGEPAFMFHVITFTDAARERILRGAGQKTPGYAKGGPVSRDAMWIAVQNKQLRKKHGN